MTWIKLDDNAIERKGNRQYYHAVPVVPCVYALYDRDGALIYIGQTTSLQARLKQHRPRKLSHIKYKVVDCEAMRKDLERRLLRRLQPERNITDTDNPPKAGFRFFSFTRRHW